MLLRPAFQNDMGLLQPTGTEVYTRVRREDAYGQRFYAYGVESIALLE